MRIIRRLSLWATTVAILGSCASTNGESISPIPTESVSPLVFVGPTALVSSTPTENVSPLHTAIALPTATSIPQPPTATEWLTYTHESGVSIQYPANWQVKPNPAYGQVVFGIQLDEAPIPNYRLVLDVYHRPLRDRSIANPYTWQPNEGGFEVRWAKPISIDVANGLEFIWSQYYDHVWNSPWLIAIYYSKQYELDVRLSTAFDAESTALIDTNGFTDTDLPPVWWRGS